MAFFVKLNYFILTLIWLNVTLKDKRLMNEKRNKWNRAYYAKNKEKLRQYYRDYRKKKGYNTFRKFGLTSEFYEKMVEKQNGRCAICSINVPENGERLAIDHSHDNGKIRGLLCRQCNLLLGCAKDSIEILENAIIYIKTYSS